MSTFDGWRHRLRVLLRGERYARETEQELLFHVKLEALARVREGETDGEGAARQTVGNVTYYREEVRRMTMLRWVDQLRQDFSYASRGLRRSPVFTTAVVVTLGLGFGVNSAMYSFLDRVLAEPPAGVVNPGSVRRLYVDESYAVTRQGSHVAASFNYPGFEAIRAVAGGSNPIAAFTPGDSVTLVAGANSMATHVSYVTADYFRLLGLRPADGRYFAADEEMIDSRAPVAVISQALWRRAFASNPHVLGSTVSIDSQEVTVVGIAPPEFSGIDLSAVEAWLPLNMFPERPERGVPWYRGDGNYLRVVTRPVSAASAAIFLQRGTAAIHSVRSDSSAKLVDGPIIEARGPLERDQSLTVSTRLAGVALLVLLIACANVTNLLILRATSRRREIAVRRALGVSRMRLYEQFLTESLLLSAIGGAVALILARWGALALRTLLLPSIHWASTPLNLRVDATVAVAVLLTGIVVGLIPALVTTKPDLSDVLKGGNHGPGRPASRTQAALLIAQAALSVVLVVGAGLFVRSLSNVQSVDIGYDPAGMLMIGSSTRDPARAQRIGQTFAQLTTQLAGRRGIAAVGLSYMTPMAGIMYSRWYLPGHDSLLKTPGEFVSNNIVSPGFFRATGLHIVAGRGFDQGDRMGSENVAVVGKRMAELVWPGEDPLGQCISIGTPTSGCTRIVGVADDVHRMAILESAGPQFYLPFAQQAGMAPGVLIVRTSTSRLPSVKALVREELTRADVSVNDYRIQSMAQILEPQLHPWKLGAVLFSAFGLLALCVTGIGIYSVVAYRASQRTHEISVRTAVGAQRSDILDLLLREGLYAVGIGIAIGVVAALLMGRLVASLLFGIVPDDPSTLIVAVVVLTVLTMVACLIPGWRAAKIDPVTALRAD